MEGCKLTQSMLDSRGNRESGWGRNQKRGGFKYIPPDGLKRYGLKVLGKYDDGNNDWLAYDNNSNEWAIAYHGVGRGKNSDEVAKITGLIAHGGFKAGWAQAHKDCNDLYHKGMKVGVGVYCSPNPDVMFDYAGSTLLNGKSYKIGFMIRVKPDKIRHCGCRGQAKDYWVLNGTLDEMRPYRIMVTDEEKITLSKKCIIF